MPFSVFALTCKFKVKRGVFSYGLTLNKFEQESADISSMVRFCPQNLGYYYYYLFIFIKYS